MASNPQIAPDTAQMPADISPRLKRKLDKHLATRDNKRGGKRVNAGLKPQWAKNLTRNTAAVVLKEASAKELWLQLLQANDRRLQFEVLRYLTDRLEGKPFVAENPQTTGRSNMLLQDNRIQVAIQQLVPAKQARNSKKAKQIEANSEAKQLVSGDQAEQTYVDATAQVIDSGQDVSE